MINMSTSCYSIMNTQLHWRTILSIIKNSVFGYFDVNDAPIENRKKGYYEFYLNGNRNIFIHVFFRGTFISSFGYQHTTYKEHAKVDEYGRISGEKKEIVDFLKYVYNVLCMKGKGRHEMENELYSILEKKFN